MFNIKQKQVINEIERNILLLASAGTGKTNTLSERIVNILDNKKALPEEILCITFTNKACKEMKERILSVVGSDATKINVSTFHGLCYEILKAESRKNIDINTNTTIYDEEDSLAVLQELTQTEFKIGLVKSLVSKIRRERARLEIYTESALDDYLNTIDIVFNEGDKFASITNSIWDQFQKEEFISLINTKGAELVVEYLKVLRRYGAVDFDDLTLLVYELFQNKSIVDALASKYKYINVDEVQDTSSLEYSIIEKIFSNSSVLLCGDKFQTIYEWRGSNPSTIFSEFKKNWNPIEVVFDCNYRATQILTEASTKYLFNAFPEEAATLFSNGLSTNSPIKGDKILYHQAKTVRDEAQWILNHISVLPEEERKNICILTRSNDYNVELSHNLRELSQGTLQFALIDDSKFFKKKEIKDVSAFLKLIANQNDATSLKRILNTVSYRIGEKTIQEIESDRYRNAGITLTDLIDVSALESNDKFSSLIDSLEDDNVIVFDVESTGTDTSRDEVIQIAAIRIDRHGKEIERFMKFLKTDKPVGSSEAVHGFSDAYIAEHGEDKTETLVSFLEFIKGRTIVGHNVQYDINILSSELARRELPCAEFKDFYDTLDIYRRFYPNLNNHKLETLSNLFDTEHKPNHNALYDILATGELLVHAVDENILPTRGDRVALMSSVPDRFKVLAEDMNSLFFATKDMFVHDIIAYVVNKYKLTELYDKNSIPVLNMREFYIVSKNFEDDSLSKRDALLDFVRLTSLSDGEMEQLLIAKGRIPIITMHQAKGLEFSHVFLAGLQDYIFPSFFAMKSKNFDEEKRLFYVALTRAKKRLYLSRSMSRRGKYQKESCLLSDLDKENIIEA